MSRRLLFWIVSCCAIGLSTCTTLRPAYVHSRPGTAKACANRRLIGSSRPAPYVRSYLDTAKACADWRWIGISRPGIQCPEIPGWKVRPLFPQLAPAGCDRETENKCDYCKEIESGNVPDPRLIQELNRFCVYEPEHPKNLFKKPKLPPGTSGDLVRLDQDCAAFYIADTELKEEDLERENLESDYENFPVEVGQPGASLQNGHAPHVRLAFLDTQPTNENFPEEAGRSPHGYTLANIARNLVCRSEPPFRCAAKITNQLALPVIKIDPKSPKLTEVDLTCGGYLGRQSDVAEAIRKEVDAWQGDRKSANWPKHLVLNLSLAWDGRLFGGFGEEWINEMQAGSQAVYRALQYAASFDVLVLAAAGNQQTEPCDSTGPLYPAAWEAEVPKEQGCPIKSREKPLLYAVGGLDSDGQRLPNARPGGMPRRAAYGEAAVVTGVNPRTLATTYTGHLYSGSSVSTAVVSSIAAVVWDAFPQLDSRAVMKILDEGGDELPFEADFEFVDPAAPISSERHKVHRLSLCKAIEDACRSLGRCPTPPPCPIWRPQPSSSNWDRKRIWSQGFCQPWGYGQPPVPPCPNCPP